MQLALALPLPTASASIASGEKAKARDIITAVKTLQVIGKEQRTATLEEKKILARFGGFGAVALSIFPDPVTNRYKDGWRSLGEELRSLLTPEEYDSAKRTTFNAFYTSPTVIKAMHQALARLGAVGLTWGDNGFTLASDRTPLQNRPWSPAPPPARDDRIVRPGHGGSHGADPADVDVAPEEGRAP